MIPPKPLQPYRILPVKQGLHPHLYRNAKHNHFKLYNQVFTTQAGAVAA